MSLVVEALKSARSLLNDDRKLHWSDVALMPKLRQGHREMQLELVLNGIPVIREVSALFTVAANAVTLGNDLPIDLVDPVMMWERAVGEADSQLIEMAGVTNLPNIEKDIRLRYWCWREEVISFLGATTDRVVKLSYKKGLPVPAKVSDSIGLTFGELYLGPRTAGLVCDSAGKHDSADVFKKMASDNIDKIIRANVLTLQRNPARRRPFGFRMRQRRFT